MYVHVRIYNIYNIIYIFALLGHHLLHISFLSRTFPEVHAGGWTLYHYSTKEMSIRHCINVSFRIRMRDNANNGDNSASKKACGRGMRN